MQNNVHAMRVKEQKQKQKQTKEKGMIQLPKW